MPRPSQQVVFPAEPVLLTHQAARCYKIERVLRRAGCVAFENLRDLVGVSPATLKRDLHYMRRTLEAPVQYDPCEHGYRLAGEWTGVLSKVEEEARNVESGLISCVHPAAGPERAGSHNGSVRRPPTTLALHSLRSA